MSILRDGDKRFVNIERKIGLFFIIAAIGTVAVITFIGIQHDTFTPKTTIFFIAESGQGINEGMAVKLSGFKIGKIRNMELDDVAKVKVTLSISKKYMKWIKTDSHAKLSKEGMIGDSIIDIQPGSAAAKPMQENSIMPFGRERGISEMIEELKNEIKPVILELKNIVQYVNDPSGDIKATLRNVKHLSDDLSSTGKRLNALLQSSDKNINDTSKKIGAVLDSTHKTVEDVNGIIKKVDKDMPGITEKVGKSLDNIQKTTEELKKAVEKSAPSIPSLIDKGNDIADDTTEITGSVKKIWPIRSYIKNPEGKLLPIDSYD
ncbi:MAG: MCE family protein [Nitrospirae bacterium]|nr:MAG: MCE family protein [Nitrospirota bacterium]